MSALPHKNWIAVFSAVAFLSFAQVAWWATTFVREVATIEQVRSENLVLRARLGETTSGGAAAEAIRREAFHRRVMFLSEAVFFAGLTCLGFFLLYRALRVEQRARESERSFIEVVTHESKTPLTALKLRLESAVEKWGGEAGLRRELKLSLQEVRRLASVFENTLNLNRIERHALQFEALPVSEVVREVLRRLDPLLRERAVRVQLELDEEALVQGDPFGLRNSVQSLIENAILHNRREGDRRIDIAVVQHAHKVTLTVRDNGPGIDPSDREKIFERFYRGKNRSSVSGTGLGLYLAKTIVEAHQGVLRLCQPETGAQFEMELPAWVSA
jgi:signal transduction histidine kinase